MTREKKYFLIFGVLTLLIYGQSLWGGFVFDDRGILEHYELLSRVENVVQVAIYPYWTVDAGLYRPTSLLSYWANIVFLGGGAWSFHLVNLLLYFGICVLVYLLLKKLFQSEKLALLSSLIFLVLPIHTEVVANITGRLELLALFFSLLTLYEVAKEDPRPYLTGLYAFLAIGSKEGAIALVPLALLIIFIQKREWRAPALLSICVGGGVYFLLRLLVLGPEHFLGVETSLIENPLLFASASERIFTALSIFTMYLSKTLWPANLCSDYSYDQIQVVKSFFSIKTFVGLVALFGSAVSSLYFWRRSPVVSLASGIIFLSFIVVSNIPFPIGTIAGERLFFFPSLGVAILLALIIKQKQALYYLALVGLVVFALLSFNRQSVWLSEERLFTNAAECSPKSVLSLSNLGTVYYFRGQYDKAQEALEKSRELKPIYSKGLNNLGLVYWKQGHHKDAMRLYHEAMMQKYPYPGVYENMVLLKLSQGEALGALRWARVAYPNVGDSSLRSLLGI